MKKKLNLLLLVSFLAGHSPRVYAIGTAQMVKYTKTIDDFLDKTDPKTWTEAKVQEISELIDQLEKAGLQRSQIPQWRKRLQQEMSGAITAITLSQLASSEQQRANTAEQNAAQLKQKLDATTRQLAIAKTDIELFDKELDKQTADLKATSDKYKELEKSAAATKSSLDSTRAQFAQQQAEKSSLDAKVKEYEAALEKQRAQADDDYMRMNAVLGDLLKTKAKLTKEMADLRTQVEAQQQKDLEEAQLTGLMLSQAQKQLNEQTRTLEELTVKSNDADAQILELQKQKNAAEKAQADTKKQLEELKKQQEQAVTAAGDPLQKIVDLAKVALTQAQALDFENFDPKTWERFNTALQLVVHAEEDAQEAISKTSKEALLKKFGGPTGPLLNITNTIQQKLKPLKDSINEDNKRNILFGFNSVIKSMPNIVRPLLSNVSILGKDDIETVIAAPSAIKEIAIGNLVEARARLLDEVDNLQAELPKQSDDNLANTAHAQKVLGLVAKVPMLQADPEIKKYVDFIKASNNAQENKAKADFILVKARLVLKQVEDEPEATTIRGAQPKPKPATSPAPKTDGKAPAQQVENKALTEPGKLTPAQVIDQVNALLPKGAGKTSDAQKKSIAESALNLVKQLPSTFKVSEKTVKKINDNLTTNTGYTTALDLLSTIREKAESLAGSH
jgi:ribulose bisphosphate carboxylase small subunit